MKLGDSFRFPELVEKHATHNQKDHGRGSSAKSKVLARRKAAYKKWENEKGITTKPSRKRTPKAVSWTDTGSVRH